MIKMLRLSAFMVILGLTMFLCEANSQTPTSTVGGLIINQQNVPIPGLTVYLVHPIVGRSYPCITDNYGHYIFYNVPIRPDPYYIEVYWGKELLYRQALYVKTAVVQFPTIKM